MIEIVPGLAYHTDYLDRSAQQSLLADIEAILAEAPPFIPTMPRTGRPFSVRMSKLRPARLGLRCQRLPLPAASSGSPHALARHSGGAGRSLGGARRLFPAASGLPHHLYDAAARMGLHQDRDEQDLDAPVLSLSLGDSCVFRIGGLARNAPTRSFRLNSGDALVLGGPARLAFHGVDRIVAGSSTLLPGGGRINLTLRRVSPE